MGEPVRVGGGSGELVWVGIQVGVLMGCEFELPPDLGRCVLVIGTRVLVAVPFGGGDVTVGEKVGLLVATVVERLRVGVIRF
jgi:hypothetical protein